MCRLATGGGFATRSLYTDDDEKVFNAQRPAILNGIDEVAFNGDVLDRALIVYLPHINESDRRTEAELHREFEAARPRILGAILDAVCNGLANLPRARLTGLPRMADFARWGCAIASRLGWTEDAFLAAYGKNRDAAHDLALEASAVGPILLEIMARERLEWEGTAAELLDMLGVKAGERAQKSRAWPGNPHALSNGLRRLAPNLRELGVKVTFLPRTNRRRLIRIESLLSDASPASPGSQPDLTQP
jgi:hypothetical protein